MRTYHPGVRVAAPRASGGSRSGAEHPLLALQRAAGNRAVTEMVQRKEKAFVSSKVALAPIAELYAGKCGAALAGASVRYHWSRGMLSKDKAIIFECGPQSFEFSCIRPWFSERGPWGIETADGGSAWVDGPVEGALDEIVDDFDDAGSAFWHGYHVITGLLAQDLQAFCADQG
jgi:hypothetical protein